MFGVLARFDPRTEQHIKQIWNALEKEQLSFYAREVQD